MITSNRTQNSAQSGILRLCFAFVLSFFLLTVGCGGGGGGDSGQAGTPSPSFATVIENSEANKSTPMSSPPIFQLDEVVQAIKSANLTAPEKVYKVALAAELSVAQVDALFVLPAGTTAAYIARQALPQPKATAQIVGLQLNQLPVSLTQARQLAVGIGLTDKPKMYAFGQMENLSSFDLNQITGSPVGTFENFISGSNASPLSGANRVTAVEAANLPVVVKDIPGLMVKKGWHTASDFMERWFAGTGGILNVSVDSVETLYGDFSPQIEIWKNLNFNSCNVFQLIGTKTVFCDSVPRTVLLNELRKSNGLTNHKTLLVGGNFDFIGNELALVDQTTSFNSEKNKMHYIGELTLNRYGLNGFTAAYGEAILRLLANGRVSVNSSGLATIAITEYGIYVRDSYDFVGEEYFFGLEKNQILGLGCWSKSAPYVAASFVNVLSEPKKCLENSDFRAYRDNSVNTLDAAWLPRGADYRIFSSVRRIPLPQEVTFTYQLTDAEMAERNTLVGTVPAVPSLSLVAKTSNSVSVQWSTPSDASYYLLNRSGVETSLLNSNSYLDSNLTPSATQTYFIKACNATGCSAASSVLTVVTDAATTPTPIPPAPTPTPTPTPTPPNQPPVVNSASAVQNSDGSLTVNFAATDPEGSTVGADVYISNPGGSTFNSASRKIVAPGASGGARSVSWSKAEADSFMVAGQTYAVRVDGFDAAGAKGQLASSSFVRNPTANQAPVVNSASVVQNADGSLTLNFLATDPEGSTIGADAYIANLGGSTFNAASKKSVGAGISGSARIISWSKAEADSFMVAGQTYAVRVDAFDTAGAKGQLASSSFQRNAAANQPPVVNGASVVQNADGSLTLNFLATDPEGSTIGADAYISNAGGGTFNAASKKSVGAGTSGSARTMSWSKAEAESFMVAGQTYAVRVDAFDTVGAKGQLASSSFVRNAAANQPPVVDRASVVQNADGSLTLNFLATDPEGSTIGADAYISNAGGSTFNAASKKTVTPGASGSARNISWSKAEAESFMVAGQTYAVRVDAFDTAGAKGQLASSSFQRNAAANQPPVVNSASVVQNADGSLTLNFAATDPEGITVGADAYISNPGGSTFNAASKKSLGAGASGSSRSISWSKAEADGFMAAGQTYAVRVDAFDTVGALGQLATNSFLRNAAANQPPVVNSASVVQNVDGSLTLNFMATDPEGGMVGVDAYISNAGGSTFNAASKKTLAAGTSGSARSITWSRAEAVSFLVVGQTYAVRVDAFDAASAKGQLATSGFLRR